MYQSGVNAGYPAYIPQYIHRGGTALALRRQTGELAPGMVLDENIYNSDKILLLASGCVLNEERIQSIKRLGYWDVRIKAGENGSGHNAPYAGPEFLHFRKCYRESKKEIINLVRHVSSGNTLNMEQASSIPRFILKEFGLHTDLFAYISMVTGLDDHTYGHCINVSLICSILCRWLKLPADTSRNAIVAGLLHDIGKTSISQTILQKPGRLEKSEWAEIKKHTIYGYQILAAAKAPDIVGKGVLCHHEREDGYGYPFGLIGPNIPITAKIVSIADMYDAMTTDRPYRDKICPFKIIGEFERNYLGSLDVRVLMAFLNRIAECYLGETVTLNDGRQGTVVFINSKNPSKPMIHQNNGQIINLKFEPELWIDSVQPRDTHH
jgi:putative nucleotidyltransferase with HDIG domain